MATTYYQTDLTKEQIEQALHAVNGVASSTNNGKVLYIDENGEIKAKSAAEWQMHLVQKAITQNGSYDPASDNADGYSSVSVAVPGPSLQSKTATQNGQVTPDTGYDGLSAVDVSVPNTYSAADEGKVVSDGALVAQTARTPSITENGTYDTTGNNSVTVNVPSQAAPVLQPKTVTENGDYYPPSGVDGFSEFHVNVQGSGGGGGEGPIYYGTSAPLSSLGNNEDLYIQYQTMASGFDHTYSIVAEFRKVSGVWVQYEIPELPTAGVHIWTKSTGGYDAAMYVQAGYWDVDNNAFVATGEAESVVYTSVRSWSSAKDCNGVVLLAYPSNWQIKASTTVTDGTSVYQANEIVASWAYSQSLDIYVWKPLA